VYPHAVAASNGFIDLRGPDLPADAAVIRYEAREALSRPFEVDVELSTADAGFHAASALRKSALLSLVDGEGRQRLFHGIIDRIAFDFLTGTRFHFKLRLRPSLSALAHRENCRIFQDQSVIEIVSTVLSEAGVDKVETQLKGTYDPRDFVVQYRESELNFVSRLLEEEGIFYFFEHTAEAHKLILADDPTAFAVSDDAPAVAFAMGQGFAGEPLPVFNRTRALRTTEASLRDYDFEKPQTKPSAVIPATDAWPMPLYEFPGGFTQSAAGSQRAKARISARRRDADVVRGESRSVGLRCGVPFAVEGAAQECLNGSFVITELHTWGEQTRDSGGPNALCQNEFSGIPKDAPYAPPQTARKPRIRGIQTATVMGPTAGEQAIHVDNYGRIKVRFHWDRVGANDDTATCWLRVSQLMMGGSMILPRVSWEVSVAFFNGDPDQPFVLGRLYNAEKAPPYPLPGAQASGSIKSMSSPGGAGHNEIKMADSGGGQGWDLHAQKDLNITIGHDKTEKVGVDETHSVTVNMSTDVGSNETIKVGGKQSIDVGAILSANIGGGQSITVSGNETSDATANFIEHISGNRTYKVSGNMTVISNTVKETVTGNYTKNVSTAEIAASIASIKDDIGGAYSEKVGAVKVELMKGMSSETVGGDKNLTSTAAELHLVTGNMDNDATGSVTNLVGGLHYAKVAGDYSVSAPIIALIGAIGDFKGGSSTLKLGGGPVVIEGSEVVIETALLVKLGASLKMGA
jgi:type VI secretion system secreted protein VgrG